MKCRKKVVPYINDERIPQTDTHLNGFSLTGYKQFVNTLIHIRINTDENQCFRRGECPHLVSLFSC